MERIHFEPHGYVHHQRIGSIELGIDGRDEYFSLTVEPEDGIEPNELACDFIDSFYRETNQPGGYFCNSGQIIPVPHYDDRFIVVIMHRYDV